MGRCGWKAPEDAAENEENLVLWKENNRRAFAGEKVEEDVTLTTKGEKRYYHNVIAPIVDAGQIQGVLGVNIDITERKRAEERLRNSERTLRTLIDASPEGIMLVDTEETLLIANETAARRLGRAVDGIVGQRLHTFLAPRNNLSQNRASPRGCSNGQTNSLRGSTSRAELEIAMHPIFDDQGKVAAVAILAIDRTDRKQAVLALQQAHDELERRVEERTAELTTANEELQAIYDGMVDGLLVVDLETKQFVRTNAAMCRLLGYSMEQLLSMTVMELHPPEVVPSILEKFRTQQEGQRFLTENRPVLKKDGTVFFADISNTRISYRGRPCVIGLFRDNTERKQAQEALQQSEEKHRTLVETCPDAVIMADLTGHAPLFLGGLWNSDLAKSADEFLGKCALDYMMPEDHRHGADNIITRRKRTASRHVEYSFFKKDGTRFPAETIFCFVKDASGKPVAIVSVLRDITERKHAAAALQQSHDELQTIYQGMVDGCVVFDTELFQDVTVNTALCTKLGYTEEEIKALTPEQKHPAYAHSRMSEYYQATLQGRKSLIEDVPIFHKDGHLLYFDIATRHISYDGRRCQLLFFHDVTDRKNAEEELRREHRTLKHLLESSDHERQLIAYEIHDELAQQLSGAIMQFQTYSYQKDVNPKLATKAFDAGMTMLQQGHNEARRLIAGVRPPILDEEGVVAAVHHLVNEERRQRGLEIEFRNNVQFDRLAPILENAIYRIVQEGLTNACQHSKSEKVKVSLLQQGNRIQIEIRDWGIGFDSKAVHENRFGLVGIRQRARLLGGKLSIRSKVDKGTRIAVELPVVARE